MKRGKDFAEEFFGKEINVTDTTEMVMNNEIYYALLQSGYRAGVLDGRKWVMDWRETTHLYNYDGRDLGLFCRHHELSDDVGYRFSNKTWSGYPLRADEYAKQLRDTWGDFVFIGWDFETFGEHHNVDTGIFDFMLALPTQLDKQGVACLTPSEAVDAFGGAHKPSLPLPEFGTTWAGGGGMEFFLGNASQQAIFRLMHSVLHKARLTGNRDADGPGALAAPVRQPASHPVGRAFGIRGRGVSVFHARRVVGSRPGQDPHRATTRVHELRPGDG